MERLKHLAPIRLLLAAQLSLAGLLAQSVEIVDRAEFEAGVLKNLEVTSKWGSGLALQNGSQEGEFVSGVLDAGGGAKWSRIRWTEHFTTSQEWKKHSANPVLQASPAGNWDHDWTTGACLVQVSPEEWRLYYSSRGQGIGFATGDLQEPTRWQRFARNPVFRPGQPGRFDQDGVIMPEIVKLSDTHWYMYYVGLGPPATDHPAAGPWLTGLAESRDGGLSWRRVSEDPIIEAGLPNTYDGSGTGTVSVLKTDRGWWMWYTAVTRGAPPLFSLALATSPDGIHWTKHAANPVLTFDPFLPYEAVAVSKPHVLYEDGVFKLWYSASGFLKQNYERSFYRISYAESEDGVHWIRYPANPVLDVGPQGSWDDRMVEYPEVVRSGETLHLWYSGNGFGDVGYAAARPGNALVELFARTGTTPAPDSTWSAWLPIDRKPEGTKLPSQFQRYVQVRAVLSRGNSNVSPILKRIILQALPLSASEAP